MRLFFTCTRLMHRESLLLKCERPQIVLPDLQIFHRVPIHYSLNTSAA
jgi:hypothetical protein